MSENDVQNGEEGFIEEENLRGKVVIPKNEGDVVRGITANKMGRKIGEDEAETVEIFDPKSGQILLLPLSHVLKEKLESAAKRWGGQYFEVIVTFLGKKQPATEKGREYNDYSVKSRLASEADVDALGEYESIRGNA